MRVYTVYIHMRNLLTLLQLITILWRNPAKNIMKKQIRINTIPDTIARVAFLMMTISTVAHVAVILWVDADDNVTARFCTLKDIVTRIISDARR